MAQVTLDSSEYDMLRETKAKAEKELAEVKQELEGLKKHSSCVVKTRRYLPNIDIKRAAQIATEEYVRALRLFVNEHRYAGSEPLMMLRAFVPGDPIPGAGEDIQKKAKEMFAFALQVGIKRAHEDKERYQNSAYVEDACLTEVVGFEELRTEIERTLREQYESSLKAKQEELDESIERYHKRYYEARTEADNEYKDQIERLEAQVKGLKDKIVKNTESFEKRLLDMKEKLTEAQKTTKERVAEAEEKVRKAQEELEALRPKQEPKSKKLFGLFG